MDGENCTWSFVGMRHDHCEYTLKRDDSVLGRALLRRGRRDLGEGKVEQAQRDASAPEHREVLSHMTGLLVFNINNGLPI